MSNERNPYEAPTPTAAPDRAPSTNLVIEGQWVPCPSCGSGDVSQPSYTWWGGVIGAKMLKHVKCQRCGTGYNGLTGKSNTGAIIAYQVVVLLIVVGFIVLFRML
jgi:hypothetical protein